MPEGIQIQYGIVFSVFRALRLLCSRSIVLANNPSHLPLSSPQPTNMPAKTFNISTV